MSACVTVGDATVFEKNVLAFLPAVDVSIPADANIDAMFFAAFAVSIDSLSWD